MREKAGGEGAGAWSFPWLSSNVREWSLERLRPQVPPTLIPRNFCWAIAPGAAARFRWEGSGLQFFSVLFVTPPSQSLPKCLLAQCITHHLNLPRSLGHLSLLPGRH